MSATSRLLILGGTGEALALAGRLAELPRLHAVSSLAGRTRSPVQPAGEMRVGGFGGADGLTRYLREQRIDLVIDATHPFAAGISASAAQACDALGLARLMLIREPWTAVAGDRWIEVTDIEAAAAALPDTARRVFLTVGRQELDAFSLLDRLHFVVRLIDAPTAPLPLVGCTIIRDRGPFAVGSEQALLIEHRIDTLVTKNSGGTATYGKIAAARALGLPVIMVRRPPTPPGERVTTVEAAVDWVRSRTG
jgi:precorrin-6A/cobalt-precorrin-6A reductase